MYIFYFILCFLFIISIYKYNKNFKNVDEFISYIFKKILLFLDYDIDDFNINELPSKIIMISSHTSVYDFIIGSLFYYGYLHSKYSTFVVMKKEFESFSSPILKLFDKKFQLISIDTSKKNIGATEQICNNLRNKNNYILYLAPEGTRRCTDNIRSGYWYISKNLNIDIIYIGIDFSLKSITLEKSRKPKNTWDEEQEEFIRCCKKYIPLYPERCNWTKNFYN
jgi:1-acyl-sn-glycerol-3-phosphate acyltransferase